MPHVPPDLKSTRTVTADCKRLRKSLRLSTPNGGVSIMPDLRPELRVSLEWRVAVWTHRATTEAGTITTIRMADAVEEIASYQPEAEPGVVTPAGVWEVLVTFDDADQALGAAYGWRAFVLIDRPRDAPDEFRVVTGVEVPREIGAETP